MMLSESECLSLWERCLRSRRRGQARRDRVADTAIRRPSVRAILSLRLRFLVSILALSVTFGDSSPKGGALGKAPAEGFFFPSDMLYYNVF